MLVGVLLPIFPLGVVLFPGMPLPLHIFEDRYRAMVQNLLDIDDDDRCLGVVAIRDGYEVGDLAVHSAHRVGCEAVLTEVQQRPDGRFDIEVVGRRRLRVDGMDESRPYLVGDVTYLVDDPRADNGIKASISVVGDETMDAGTLTRIRHCDRINLDKAKERETFAEARFASTRR